MITTASSAVLIIRVLALVIYSGLLFFYFVGVLPTTRRFPPTHRAAIAFPLARKTAWFSFIVLIVLSLSGLAYAQMSGLLHFTLHPTGMTESVLTGEFIVNGLMVLVGIFAIIILFVKRNVMPSSLIASSIDDAKWLKFEGSAAILKKSSQADVLYLINLFCSLLLIVFGVLVQQG